MRRSRLVPMSAAVAVGALLLLTACSDAGGGSHLELSPDDAGSFGPSALEKDPAIAALVPEAVASSGKLVVGSDTSYAPAEYIDEFGVPAGYDVDIARAIAVVLGLEADIQPADFGAIIPETGSTYDLGISSFTINAERLAEANMVQYFQAGEAFAVEKGNPKQISGSDLCGLTVGVQTGTIEEEELATLSGECTAAGKNAITPVSLAKQTDVTATLIDGKADLMYADSPIIAHAILEEAGQLEQLGDVFASAPQGIVVSKDAPALTSAVQQAVQKLITSGDYGRILTGWGVQAGAVTTAEINPAID